MNIVKQVDQPFYSRRIIDSIMAALIMTNSKGKITDLNKAAEMLTGYAREKLINSAFSHYLVDPENAIGSILKSLREAGVIKHKLILRTISGVYRMVFFTVVKIHDQQGGEQFVFTADDKVVAHMTQESPLQQETWLTKTEDNSGDSEILL
jgi:PAS domain S-box-containing protein